MRTRIRYLLLPAAVLLLTGTGCVTGKVLYLPGDLYRPTAGVPAPPPEGPSVAVLDFSFAGTAPYEIGRDFDHARSIVWKGEPGKAVADLVAGVLEEQGIPTVRVSSESDVPPAAAVKMWGRVDELRVSTKKTGSLRVTVEVASSVAVTLYASGGGAPPGWSSSLSSDFLSTEPLFVTTAGVHAAVSGAANAVAEEAVKRLFASGAVRPPAAPLRAPGEGSGR